MIFSIILTTVFAFVLVHHYRKVSRLPPGPFSIPFIGNIFQIVYYGWKTGGVVSALQYFRQKYGMIFTIWLGPLPLVNITDYDVAHEVFVKHGNKYADKLFSPIFNKSRNGMGIVAVNGSYWQEARRFSLQTFRNMGIGKDIMETRIMEEFSLRCDEMDKKSVNGVSVVKVADFFDLTVGSIINSVLMGSRFDETNKHEFLHLKNLVEEATKMVSPVDLILPIWMLTTFSKKRYETMMNSQYIPMEYLAKKAVKRYEDVKEGKITIDQENPSDYVDSFIVKMLQEGSNKDVFNIPSLKSILLDLWLTGQETTTTTLISGFTNLLNHPQVMDKLREELMNVTEGGSRSLSQTDKNDTPYLNAVIAEIQRFASILNINFWKVNHEYTAIGGFPVDAGALVSAQLSLIHIDKDLFPHPEKFDPERFIRDKELMQKLIPFGIGKRACTGEALARAELYLLIGNLILRYKFEPHGKLVSNIDLAPYSFAKRPEHYEMKFIKI